MSTQPGTGAASVSPADPIAAIRHFNRFYTTRIGILNDHLLQSQFSLTEVRVLYELAHRDRVSAAELAKDLGLDPGYLSRVLRGFGVRGLVAKARDPGDARQIRLTLTDKGGEVFSRLDARQTTEVAAMLEGISPLDRTRISRAMKTIESLLEHASSRTMASFIRRSGAMTNISKRSSPRSSPISFSTLTPSASAAGSRNVTVRMSDASFS
jgi:DNA-binding MarR family transcriptional regulator